MVVFGPLDVCYWCVHANCCPRYLDITAELQNHCVLTHHVNARIVGGENNGAWLSGKVEAKTTSTLKYLTLVAPKTWKEPLL